MIIYTEYFNFKPCVVYADSKMRFIQKKTKQKNMQTNAFIFYACFYGLRCVHLQSLVVLL